jgi:penicillin-binding protein 2A
MAKAYSAFANQGVMIEPYLIREIVDSHGDKVAVHKPEPKRIISEQTAWYMTEMLRNVVRNGTGKNAQFNHPVAGKTGTNEYNGADGNQDAWFVGYTPYLTAAVWLGFDKTDPQHTIDTTGGGYPARLFRHVMSQVMEDYPVKQFERPSGVQELKPPVRLQQISDLKAFLRISNDFNFAVDLEFSHQNDDRVAYNIYRIDAGGSRTLAATINRGESWSDTNVALNETYSYEVAPVNKETGEEGPASNRVTVTVSPEYPFIRLPDEFDEEAYEEWLRDILGLPAEEEEPGEEEGKGEGENGTGEEEPSEGQPGQGEPGQGQPGEEPPGNPSPGDQSPGEGPPNGQNPGNGQGQNGGQTPPGQGQGGNGNQEGDDSEQEEAALNRQSRYFENGIPRIEKPLRNDW